MEVTLQDKLKFEALTNSKKFDGVVDGIVIMIVRSEKDYSDDVVSRLINNNISFSYVIDSHGCHEMNSSPMEYKTNASYAFNTSIWNNDTQNFITIALLEENCKSVDMFNVLPHLKTIITRLIMSGIEVKVNKTLFFLSPENNTPVFRQFNEQLSIDVMFEFFREIF